MENGSKDVLFARGGGQSDESDIWDDTALIKAYDKAVDSFKTALKGESDPPAPKKDPPGKKRKNNKHNLSRKRSNAPPDKEWQVGDSCSAYWSEDGQLYAATICAVDKKRATCTVVYTDYGNQEEHSLQDLLLENSEVEEETCVKVNEAESSTEESDRSTTPHGHRRQPAHNKPPKYKTPREPPPVLPPGLPGFPLGPPPMPGFKSGGSSKRSGGPAPPAWPPMMPCGPPMIPPPPPLSPDMEDDEALGAMLISWYMSGYHTGYYLGLKQAQKEAASCKKSQHK